MNSSDGDEEEDYDLHMDANGWRMEEEYILEKQGTDRRIEVHSILFLASTFCVRLWG
jgi:hypothetical protein